MKTFIALSAAAFALVLGLPAGGQTMQHRETTRVETPAGTTTTRTVERDDGSRAMVGRVDHNDGSRTVVRRVDHSDGSRTVVRRTVRNDMRNTGWHRHNRHCATRWHHGNRVTRCWSR